MKDDQLQLVDSWSKSVTYLALFVNSAAAKTINVIETDVRRSVKAKFLNSTVGLIGESARLVVRV